MSNVLRRFFSACCVPARLAGLCGPAGCRGGDAGGGPASSHRVRLRRRNVLLAGVPGVRVLLAGVPLARVLRARVSLAGVFGSRRELCGYDRCGYDRAATCATTALYDALSPPDARDATHDTFDVNAD